MAGTLKPVQAGKEGKWVVNSSYDNMGSANNDLFDGLRGDYQSGNVFYWNASHTYLDVTLLQNSAIWVLPNNSWLQHNAGLKLSKWDGTSFVNVSILPDRPLNLSVPNPNEWTKMVELETGRYKFSHNSGYRMDDEWFIESLIFNSHLLKSNNKVYSLKSAGHLTQMQSITKDNFINYGGKLLDNLNTIQSSKNYILQDAVSENEDGLRVQDISRKPLSIKFE